MKKIFFFALLFSFFAAGAKPLLKTGTYRAALVRKDGREIVFNFDVKDSAGRTVLYVRNAGERLLVDNITRAGDSVVITLPFFESQLRVAVQANGDLRGFWLKRGADAYSVVDFRADYGVRERFGAGTAVATATAVSSEGVATAVAGASVAGTWKAVFSPGRKDSSEKVGEFRQDGSVVTGTFLDPTGDFRYLEGVIDGDSLRLSCFDGGHAYLFTARVVGDQLVGGQYYAGAVWHEEWGAVKDGKAALPDEFALTKWNEAAGPVKFSYRDLEGKTVSLSDARFKGKVVLLQIMGSWCPNCMDETNFLSGFYKTYRGKGVEIIGLAYERSTDFARSQKSLRNFQQRFNVEYPILITGVTVGDPDRAKKTLPQLDEIVGFPTTIFLDRTGKIVKIHTGFSGPGTGDHYLQQQAEFKAVVDEMLKKG